MVNLNQIVAVVDDDESVRVAISSLIRSAGGHSFNYLAFWFDLHL